VLVRGREATATYDFEVEIAQNAMIADPVVNGVFSGLVLSFYPYPQQRGFGARAELDLLWTPDPTRRPTEGNDGGDLYLPRVSRADFQHSGGIEPGAEVALGEGPLVTIGAETFVTRQVLRVTGK
jgi:hypothetical protein